MSPRKIALSTDLECFTGLRFLNGVLDMVTVIMEARRMMVILLRVPEGRRPSLANVSSSSPEALVSSDSTRAKPIMNAVLQTRSSAFMRADSP